MSSGWRFKRSREGFRVQVPRVGSQVQMEDVDVGVPGRVLKGRHVGGA